MKRAETVKVLTMILQRKESELQALQTSVNSLRAAIEEVSITDDSCFTKPQNGTFKQKITDAIHEVLNDGPLHRRVILESVATRGVHVGGGVHTVGAYLSVDDRFENVGKGIWGLKTPEPSNNGSSGHTNDSG